MKTRGILFAKIPRIVLIIIVSFVVLAVAYMWVNMYLTAKRSEIVRVMGVNER